MVNDNTEILIRADDKLPNNITLKNVLILITWIIKDITSFINNQFQKNYQQQKKVVKLGKNW